MFESVFNLHLYVSGPLIIGLLVLFGIGGVLLSRRFLHPRLHLRVQDSEFTGAIVQCVMVFYGLAMALIAVNAFDGHSDASKVVSGEATALNAVYRDITSYPEPIRTALQNELRDYTVQVFEEAWPKIRRGEIPTAGIEHMSRFQATLNSFEPATEGQKLMHAETLRSYNNLIQARRERLDIARTGLPGVMWLVIIAGAFISLISCFFFQVDDGRLHVIMVTLLATFIGLVMFLILALDRPFRGDLGIGPEPYRLLYDQLMKP